MWKFLREENGRLLPNANEAAELICDAFIFVKRQDPAYPGMTVLARTGIAKGPFGRPRGESIERSWRFTKHDAVATAVFAAKQIAPAFARFAPNDDRVSLAIAAASGEDKDAVQTASFSVHGAIIDARAAGDGAAEYAAESARAAVVAAMGADAGKALHAAAYSILYSIQGAYKIGFGEDMTQTIEKWLYEWIHRQS